MNILYLQEKVKAKYNCHLLFFTSVFLLLPLKMEWGFYAHKKINYYAVFTIPPPLNQLLKEHIHYISEHAIDPDKRRYANAYEGWRHYIDLDKWIVSDSCILEQNYFHDRVKTGSWSMKLRGKLYPAKFINFDNERLYLEYNSSMIAIDSVGMALDFLEHYYNDQFTISKYLLNNENIEELIFKDSLLTNGILPYYFLSAYDQLVEVMKTRDIPDVLQKCAELGHYISDAHVPLHTTSNYDGQMTGQEGIHAFWETRIPELFAENTFDNWVGKAEYIENKSRFIWDTVLSSYQLVDKVLEAEIVARTRVEEQDHFCFENRGSQFIRTQCPVFARAYKNEMGSMVEHRWKSSIKAVGSVWYSAWLDAGKPALWKEEIDGELEQNSTIEKLQDVLKGTKILGRDH